jgi:hypothetical protein
LIKQASHSFALFMLLPFVGIVVARHERFSAQARPLASSKIAPVVKCRPDRLRTERGGNGYPVRAKQPLGGMVTGVVMRISELSTQK